MFYKKENIKGARNLIFRRDFYLTIYAKYATTNMQNISSSLTLASWPHIGLPLQPELIS